MTYTAVLWACTGVHIASCCQYYVYLEPGEHPGRCPMEQFDASGNSRGPCGLSMYRVGEFELVAA